MNNQVIWDREKNPPSVDRWLTEAKVHPSAKEVGMYLVHNGTVRITPKAQAREGVDLGTSVEQMEFSYDPKKVQEVLDRAASLKGIHYLRLWLNQGLLNVGDDIMVVLIGGDIRPNVIDGLQQLVGDIKNHCVVEKERTVLKDR